MAGEEEDMADLFGDYDSEAEAEAAAAGGQPAASSSGDLPVQASQTQPDEQDIFGGGSDEEEAEQAQKGSKRKGGKAAGSDEKPPKAAKVDVSRFFDVEAEEAGGSGDEDDDAMLDDMIDDTGAEPGEKGKSKLRSQLQKMQNQANTELDDVKRDMASRGPEVGARRVFGSSFLDKMEEKYAEVGEEAAPDDLSIDDLGEAAAPANLAAQAPVAHAPAARRAEPHAPGTEDQSQPTHIVPAEGDPKIWCCKTFGPEKELCISLMFKAHEVMAKGQVPQIYSAFYSPHLRGYLYVEAFREADIRDFIKGIRGISPWNISVVPQSQMSMVFQASVTDASYKKTLKVGDWVRIKQRKPYQNDLAQIYEVNDEDYWVKLKPRLQLSGERSLMVSNDKASREARKRPAPRWFQKTDVEAAGLMVNSMQMGTAQGNLWYYTVNEELYRDGFLLRKFKHGNLIVGETVRPQEHEIQDWKLCPPVSAETRPEEDLPRADYVEDRDAMPPPSIVPKKAQMILHEAPPLEEGDIVIVNSGELVNLKGRVVKAMFRASTVTVRPMDIGQTADIELSTRLLSKHFDVGDYVKVCAGPRKGDVGYVMSINFGDGPKWNKDTTASVLSGSMTAEFEVRIEYLRLTAEKAEAKARVDGFEVGGLVHLEGRGIGSRGLLVRLEPTGNRAVVLMADGSRQTVGFQEISPVPGTGAKGYGKGFGKAMRSLWTLDRKGIKVTPKCIVKAPRGQNKAAPIQCEVMYVHNDTLFMKALEGLTGERAFLVASGKKCEFVFDNKDADDLLSKKREDKKPKPEEQAASQQNGKLTYGVQMASDTTWLAPWFKQMMGMESERNVTQKGSAVRITGGGYKGLRAEVRDFMGDKVRVSLLCKPKLVTVPLSFVAPDDYANNPKRLARKVDGAAGPATPAALGDVVQNLGLPAPPPPPSDAGDEAETLNEQNSWDPNFLMEKKPALQNVPSQAPSAAATPSLALANAPAGEPKKDTAARRKKKRESRIPTDGAEAARPFTPTETMVRTSETNTFVPESPHWQTQAAAPQTWLAEGVGVRFSRDGQSHNGWVINVYGDTAQVALSTVEPGDTRGLYNLEKSQCLPWICENRGDEFVIHEGQHVGTRGKVVGFDQHVAYVQPEGDKATKKKRAGGLFGGIAGNSTLHIDKFNLVKFSSKWVAALKEQRGKPRALEEFEAGAAPDRAPDGGSPVPAEPPAYSAVDVSGTTPQQTPAAAAAEAGGALGLPVVVALASPADGQDPPVYTHTPALSSAHSVHTPVQSEVQSEFDELSRIEEEVVEIAEQAEAPSPSAAVNAPVGSGLGGVPAVAGEAVAVGDSPMASGVVTPLSVQATDLSFAVSTPVPGATTPLLGAEGEALGAATPGLTPQSAGVQTPVDVKVKAGDVTPQPAGALDPKLWKEEGTAQGSSVKAPEMEAKQPLEGEEEDESDIEL